MTGSFGSQINFIDLLKKHLLVAYSLDVIACLCFNTYAQSGDFGRISCAVVKFRKIYLFIHFRKCKDSNHLATSNGKIRIYMSILVLVSTDNFGKY